MSNRFEGLKKIPEEPAARILAGSNIKLETKLDAPVSAPVSEVLAELDEKEAVIDMVRLLTAALPSRECVWWGCLSARDILGKEGNPLLKASEAWVFDPSVENREKIKTALDAADPDDPANLCGTAAYYGPGNMGSGDLEEIDAPVGALANCVFGTHLTAADESGDMIERLKFINERALDIAKGGNGGIPEPEGDSEDGTEA